MLCVPRQIPVRCVQLVAGEYPDGVRKEPVTGLYFVITAQGAKVYVSPGWWVVRDHDGDHWDAYSATDFARLFEPYAEPVPGEVPSPVTVDDILKDGSEGKKGKGGK